MQPVSFPQMASLLQLIGDSKLPLQRGNVEPGMGMSEGAKYYGGGRSQAKIGGEKGVNGYDYKGGQFLPSTDAPPGTFRVGRKLVKARKMEVAPGQYEAQPTANSVAVYQAAAPGFYTKLNNDGTLSLNPGAGGMGIRDYAGNAVTLDSPMVSGKTLGDLIDLYHQGVRWVEK